jgi:ribulose-phosphate 3-epimerase
MKIIPTIFAHNKKEFQERFSRVLPLAKNIQIDIMDGKFVPAKSISLSQIPNLKRYNKNFEAHLMVKNPQKRIPKLRRLGIKKFIFHFKAVKNVEQIIQRARNHKLSPWMAINPEVPIKKILPFLKKIDGVLFLGVKPGKEKQSFIPSVYKKIRSLRSIDKKIKIQVDGGVNEKTIKKIKSAGADIVNSGSYISQAISPMQALKKLRSLI